MREKAKEETMRGSEEEGSIVDALERDAAGIVAELPGPKDWKKTDEKRVPRFPDDYAFAQRLIIGSDEAWREHLKQWKIRSAAYIERRYPGLFNDDDKENILQEMEARLLKNDRKYLRDYRGMQSLSKHIEQQLEWATLTELRNRTVDLLSGDEYDDENEDVKGPESPKNNADEGTGGIGSEGERDKPEIPPCIMELPDNQRWVYLLRYYDDFGFPDSEIALLAKRRNMSQKKLSKLIDGLLEPTGQDVLAKKRADLTAANERIDKYLTKIYLFTIDRQKLEKDIEDEVMGGVDVRMTREKVEEIDDEITKTRQKLERAIAERSESSIETPYEVVGQILGEENMNTLRSRLLSARKKLSRKLAPGNKEQNPENRRLNR